MVDPLDISGIFRQTPKVEKTREAYKVKKLPEEKKEGRRERENDLKNSEKSKEEEEKTRGQQEKKTKSLEEEKTEAPGGIVDIVV